jgi:very-short-patch-repair endonuclease/predicted transcriptional regulator of viral defense system
VAPWPTCSTFRDVVHTERGTHGRELANVAARQHGVVALWQLIGLGLTGELVRQWVAKGRLHTVHRGVYAVGHPLLTLKGRLMAAVLACGPGASVSHRTAAMVRRLLDDSRTVIDVAAASNRRSRPGIQFHRVRHLHPSDVTEIDGIPVTSVARTLLDIASLVPQRRLVHALECAEKAREFDMFEIEALLRRCQGHRGAKPLQRALRAIEPEAQHAHEGLERAFIAFCSARHIEAPVMNAVVEGFTVDALWAKAKLIVELDSWKHHRGRRAFEEDRRRDAVLALAGYQPLRVTHRWLTRDPGSLELTIRRLLAEDGPPAAA